MKIFRAWSRQLYFMLIRDFKRRFGRTSVNTREHVEFSDYIQIGFCLKSNNALTPRHKTENMKWTTFKINKQIMKKLSLNRRPSERCAGWATRGARLRNRTFETKTFNIGANVSLLSSLTRMRSASIRGRGGNKIIRALIFFVSQQPFLCPSLMRKLCSPAPAGNRLITPAPTVFVSGSVVWVRSQTPGERRTIVWDRK